LSLNRRAELLEIPLLVMDRSLLGYMNLTPDEAAPVMMACLDRCREVGGVFSVVWHNNTLLDPAYRAAYLNLLDTCSEVEHYDWRTDNWEESWDSSR
jgi:hypothetical protein